MKSTFLVITKNVSSRQQYGPPVLTAFGDIYAAHSGEIVHLKQCRLDACVVGKIVSEVWLVLEDHGDCWSQTIWGACIAHGANRWVILMWGLFRPASFRATASSSLGSVPCIVLPTLGYPVDAAT